MWVTDLNGCDFCGSTGLVENTYDSRLQEACPMCAGNGRLSDDDWYGEAPDEPEETFAEWRAWVEQTL